MSKSQLQAIACENRAKKSRSGAAGAGEGSPKRRSQAARARANGSTPSAAARPRAAPTCATCSAARARTSPRWRNLGLPVPPGFTITTEVCTHYLRRTARPIRRSSKAQVEAALAEVGRITGKKFGDAENPLLVSVRSGARASMPGMMDTVLNLGLNDETVEALAKKSGDRRFAYDSYRRFITMYSNVVLGIEPPSLRGNPRRPQGPQRLHARHRSRRRRLGGARRRATRSASRRRPASRSRRTRTSSCGARSARCSARG